MSVETLISDAQSYAAGVTSDARSAMSDAVTMAQAVGYSIPNYQPATLPLAPSAVIAVEAPTLNNVELVLPSEPVESLIFQDISPVDEGIAPLLTTPAPDIVMPTTPSQLPTFSRNSPSVNTSIAFPEPPSLLLNPLIDAPNITSRIEPEKPQTVVPSFTSTSPVDDTKAPTNIQQSFEIAYRSAAPNTIAMMDGYVDAMLSKYNPRYAEQMAAIETQLAKYMRGGTGLNSSVENAIYERSRAKNDAESRRVRQSILADSAARGFTIPSGAMASAMQQARQAGADNNAAASREIVVMQAEMEQKNLQFAVTTSAGLRTALLNATLSYHQNLISINGQALDYAKTVMSSIIEVYNTAVKAFTVKLEAYKADAVVYETKLKSAMAGIELYRLEVAALEALTNVDRAKVDVYRARIDSLASLSNVYRAQIEAVQGRVGLEKLKLDVFQSEVQAYSAQVQAKNAEWQGYSAAIGGQTAKAQIFSTQVQAYAAQIGGYKATIEAKSEVIRATAITNQARADQFKATMEGYKTVVQARGEKARTEIQMQSQSLVAYQAKIQAAIGNAQVQQTYYKTAADVAINNASNNLQAQFKEVESKRNYAASVAQLANSNAQIFSSLASSAMSGINTLASEIKNQ